MNGSERAAVRQIKVSEPAPTELVLANAARQASERNYSNYLIVDADAHHYESESWAEMASYLEDPVIRRLATGGGLQRVTRGNSLLPSPQSDNDLSGRIPRYGARSAEKGEAVGARDAVLARRAMDAMGIDFTILFPSPMLQMGLHPSAEIEVAIARAYARWMTERILPAEPRIRSLLYLPFNDPAACNRIVEEFSGCRGVVGFMVTSVHYRAIHHNDYLALYRALEEKEMPLAVHSGFNWSDRSFEVFNRFLSVHAVGFPFHNMVHLTNWVVNGMPERFPGLRTIWIEGGLAFLPFLMTRLDHEYMMRSSEAPLLRKLPSEYMRELFYTSQPIEIPSRDLRLLELTFEMISAESQLLYASDYPHWDFDLPSRIFDLPFLNDKARRQILGQNAFRLFRLDRQ